MVIKSKRELLQYQTLTSLTLRLNFVTKGKVGLFVTFKCFMVVEVEVFIVKGSLVSPAEVIKNIPRVNSISSEREKTIKGIELK